MFNQFAAGRFIARTHVSKAFPFLRGLTPASLMCNPFPMGDQNAGLRMSFKSYMAMGVTTMMAAKTQTMGYPSTGANGMDSVTGRKVRQVNTFMRLPSTATGVS